MSAQNRSNIRGAFLLFCLCRHASPNQPTTRFLPPALKRHFGRRKLNLPRPRTIPPPGSLPVPVLIGPTSPPTTTARRHRQSRHRRVPGIARARNQFRAGALLSGHDYGQLARAEAPSLAAYRLVRQMEREFKTAADLDKSFDYAGPERTLGLLYRDAPGWPVSIGSRRTAREYLELAAKLAPDYPGNHLNLVEIAFAMA